MHLELEMEDLSTYHFTKMIQTKNENNVIDNRSTYLTSMIQELGIILIC